MSQNDQNFPFSISIWMKCYSVDPNLDVKAKRDFNVRSNQIKGIARCFFVRSLFTFMYRTLWSKILMFYIFVERSMSLDHLHQLLYKGLEMWISRVTFCARRNTYHFVCFNRLISIWLYVTIFWWDHEYHVHIWNCFLFFSLSLSRFRCKLWPLACNVMWCREEFLVFFVCFVWIPLKSDFVVCILFSFVVCWCVPVFVEEMMHIKCAIHFHYAVVLMADSFLFFLYFSLSLM